MESREVQSETKEIPGAPRKDLSFPSREGHGGDRTKSSVSLPKKPNGESQLVKKGPVPPREKEIRTLPPVAPSQNPINKPPKSEPHSKEHPKNLETSKTEDSRDSQTIQQAQLPGHVQAFQGQSEVLQHWPPGCPGKRGERLTPAAVTSRKMRQSLRPRCLGAPYSSMRLQTLGKRSILNSLLRVCRKNRLLFQVSPRRWKLWTQ